MTTRTCLPSSLDAMLGLMWHAPRWARWLTFVSWMLLITYWSDQSRLPIDEPAFANLLMGLQHRLAHLIAFGGLALVGRWALDGSPRAGLMAVLLTAVFAGLDEWHQSLVPGRRAGIDDWFVDILSACLGVYVWGLTSRIRGPLRVIAPLVVGCLLALVVLLTVRAQIARPPELGRAAVRTASAQVVSSTREMVRSVRDAARQLRASIAG